jgi:hypothetical protein
MSKRKLIVVVPVFLMLFVLLAGMLADYWLESSGGRQLLERELSSGLGVPVRLTGDYSMSLLPYLKIEGEGLELGDEDGRGILGRGEHFWSVIELTPFLSGQIRIKSIGLSGGLFYLDQLSEMGKGKNQTGTKALPLPEIASLEIKEFDIRTSRNGSSVLLDHLRLSGFKPGHSSPVDVEARFINKDKNTVGVQLHGNVNVAQGGKQVRLEDLMAVVRLPELTIEDFSGSVLWNRQTQKIKAQVDWNDLDQIFELKLELDTEAPVSGLAQMQHQLGDDGLPSSADIDFSLQDGQVILSRIDLVAAQQDISGAGCFLFTETPALHARFQSDELDLDAIQSLMPESETDSVGFQDNDLPIDLNVLFEVNMARYSGADVKDLSLLVGKEPDCANIASQTP